MLRVRRAGWEGVREEPALLRLSNIDRPQSGGYGRERCATRRVLIGARREQLLGGSGRSRREVLVNVHGVAMTMPQGQSGTPSTSSEYHLTWEPFRSSPLFRAAGAEQGLGSP